MVHNGGVCELGALVEAPSAKAPSLFVLGAGSILLGTGASALANIITREVHKKKGFRPALTTAMALTAVGTLLTLSYYRAAR